jgi:uncharacterized membrane protein
MKFLLVSYLAALATLAVLDVLWLGLIARSFYKARLGPLLLDQPKWVVALFFYLIHAAGVVVFATPLADSWLMALGYGAAFGFCVYAAYDISNLATVRGWPAAISAIDLAWGASSTAVASAAAFAAIRATA